jgi:hypothetical protein
MTFRSNVDQWWIMFDYSESERGRKVVRSTILEHHNWKESDSRDSLQRIKRD